MGGAYEAHLEAALARYEAVVGRRPAASLLDRALPSVRQAYARFVRRPVVIEAGAGDGAWLAFELGLKPMVRELVDAARVDALTELVTSLGGVVRAGPIGAATDPLSGISAAGRARRAFLRGRGRDPMAPALDRATGEQWLVIAGRDVARVDAAFELDSRLLGQIRSAPQPADVTALGELLGYPGCCVKAYADLLPIHDNRYVIKTTMRRSERFDPLLNNLSLGSFHHIPWFPCAYDCPESIAIATRVDEALLQRAPSAHAAVHKAAVLPRLYMDDRRQVILDGRVQADGSVAFVDAYTPFALDRQRESAGFEWVFYVDVVQPILLGDVLRVEQRELVVEAAGAVVARLPRASDAWLPFQGPIAV